MLKNKKCHKCKKTKNIKHFYKNNKNKDNLHTWCDLCISLNKKETRVNRINKKICINCKNPVKNTILCQTCKHKKSVLSKSYYNHKKHNNLCTSCSKNKPIRGKNKCNVCTNKINKKQRVQREQLKIEVINHYSKGLNKCNCCSANNFKFLTIGHINNDGAKEGREIEYSFGSSFYRWLKKNKYPKGYQVLCWNCNCGRAQNGGICPHKE